MSCEFCNSPVHIWFDCPKKPDGWKPERLRKKSTAARKDVQGRSDPSAPKGRNERASGLETAAHVVGEKRKPKAGTQAPPVDTKFNKREWMRLYMREHRKGIRRRPA